MDNLLLLKINGGEKFAIQEQQKIEEKYEKEFKKKSFGKKYTIT